MGVCASAPKLNAAFRDCGTTLNVVPPPPEAYLPIIHKGELSDLIERLVAARGALLALTDRLKMHPSSSVAVRRAAQTGEEEDQLHARDMCAATTQLLLQCRDAVSALTDVLCEVFSALLPAAGQDAATVARHLSTRGCTEVLLPHLAGAALTLFEFDAQKAASAAALNDISFFRRAAMALPVPREHPLHQDRFDATHLMLWFGAPLPALTHASATLAEHARRNPVAARGLFAVANVLIASVAARRFGPSTPAMPAVVVAAVLVAFVVCAADIVAPAFNDDSEVSGAYLVSTLRKMGEPSARVLRVLRDCAPNALGSSFPLVRDLLRAA
eukprot:gnl/Chilomastix_cuspidata/3117.p2 GENE.gnl/Chilomastix_cuspidata/3117~~gnl/Chilomastix_cuspidata/3117.p2  ORF type:complete len:329 (-),score=133.49 gnl/Chilomastix_cuspidata/3117:57-1043(-)